MTLGEFTRDIEIKVAPDVPVDAKLMLQIRMLLLVRKRTMPGSRGFGLACEFLDMVGPSAINTFAVEFEDALSEFIPQVTCERVTGEVGVTGKTPITVYLTAR